MVCGLNAGGVVRRVWCGHGEYSSIYSPGVCVAKSKESSSGVD